MCLYLADLYTNEVYHHHSSYTKLFQGMLLTFVELEPNKVVCYGQIGTYERVHVLFITNYVKYITYFKESILPN